LKSRTKGNGLISPWEEWNLVFGQERRGTPDAVGERGRTHAVNSGPDSKKR